MDGIWFRLCLVLSLAIICAYFRLGELAAALVLLLLLWAVFKKEQTLMVFTCFLVLTAGMLYTNATVLHSPVNAPDTDIRISGTIINRPRQSEGKCSFVLETDQPDPYRKHIQVFCFFTTDLVKNQRIALQGELRRPDEPGNPGEFDYAAYLEYEQVFYILTVKEPEDLQIMGIEPSFLSFLEDYRARSIGIIKSILAPDQAGILIGMLLGDVSGIDQDEYREYQKTGIVHIFSVSGMHIGFLALLCSALLSRLGFSRLWVLVVSLTILLLYATLVDWPSPVARSVVMAALALMALYSGRENNLLNSLGLSGLLILLHEPTALFQISFQLSFLAAWGLVFLYPRWKRALPDKGPWIDWLLIPLAAQAAVLPLIAYYFHIFSPVSLLANLLLAYLSELVVMIGFLFLLIGAVIAPMGTVMLKSAGLIIDVIRSGNHLILQLPGAYLWVAAPGALAVCMFYPGLYLLTGDKGSKEVRIGLMMVGLFLVLICLPASCFNRGQMEVVFLDVGQGDCILLKTPQGKFILIDGGGSAWSDVGSRKVLPYLRHRGINRLYWAVNTHPDVDHLAGLQTVVRELPVGTALAPTSLAKEAVYDSWRDELKGRGIELKGLSSGQILREGLWSLEVVYSGKDAADKDYNGHSLALLCKMRDFSVLLTGDLDQEILRSLDEKGKLHPVNVLKLPHHGSKYSLYPPLYQKARPAFAVISVGKRNIFGHPSPLVLKSLQDEGIRVLRTDQMGAVTFISQGRGFEVRLGPRQTRLEGGL